MDVTASGIGIVGIQQGTYFWRRNPFAAALRTRGTTKGNCQSWLL